MKVLVRGLFCSIVLVGLVFNGCERQDSYDGSYHTGGSSQGEGITVRVENQSGYMVVVYKGDAPYARLEPGQSVSVYAYLVGDQKLHIGVSTPFWSAGESFKRWDSYSNFVVYNDTYDVESQSY